MSSTIKIPTSPVERTLPLTRSPSSSSSSSSSAAAAYPSPSSPSSPVFLRVQNSPIGLNRMFKDNSASTSSSSPPRLLKMNRPARLDIPITNMGFASDGFPETPTGKEVVEVEGVGYSVYCKKGRRHAMEDRYYAVVNLHGDPKQAFFGVFDGHGGAKAAEFAAENLATNILHEVDRRDEVEIQKAVKSGYLNTDSDFLKEPHRGGSCCVTALIRNGNLVVSNAGDCRAVMSRRGIAVALTSDHRPSRADERERIENSGGYVDYWHGVWRVGCLAVCRGIGDGALKQWITAEPETKILKIEFDLEFLILASDGLWDKVSNQEAIDIARPLCIGIRHPQPLSACKKLAALSVSRGSTDDISVMLIQLGHFS